MNGLGLRITHAKKDNNKPSSSGISAIKFSKLFKKFEMYTKYAGFLHASNADEQLIELKKLVSEQSQGRNPDFVSFLTVVFLEGDLKHPIKGFVSRFVTKHEEIQDAFKENLIKNLLVILNFTQQNVTNYTDMVKKVIGCSENFPIGSAALKSIEIEILMFTKNIFQYCIQTLNYTNNLSPTEKNSIFNLIHLNSRIQLIIIQKINIKNDGEVQSLLSDIKSCIVFVLLDVDVPMDTKSICGLLYILIHNSINGPDSWTTFLTKEMNMDHEIDKLLQNEPAQLTLHSGITTVVPVDALETCLVDDEIALIVLVKRILLIGERCSTESTLILCVARTLLHICKNLERLQNETVGKILVSKCLNFIWNHLEHYMDSVRHLTAQSFSFIVRYCCKLCKQGHDQAINDLFSSVMCLPRDRKSYFVSLTALILELGASQVMHRIPDLNTQLINALNVQAVQASATTTLETLLQKYIKEVQTEEVMKIILEPLESMSLEKSESGSEVLHILENIIAKAMKWDQNVMNHILLYIEQKCSDLEASELVTDEKLKCVLVLLNVARKSGVIGKLNSERGQSAWKGVLHYDVLKRAAVNPSEEIRILSLSVVIECPKTTESFAAGDFDYVIWFLKYNMNTQSPHFRQLTLSLIKKFVQRIEDSYRVLKRYKNEDENSSTMYLGNVEKLRKLCFDSLIPGANYSRRVVALQLLVWCEALILEGYLRLWTKDYVEKLLNHLDDSYENNKALVLEILDKCPIEMLVDSTHNALNLEYVLKEASSVKPTDCVSAAYKLGLKQKLLNLQQDNKMVPHNASYSLLCTLVEKLKKELEIARSSILLAASQAPMYGLLHCMCYLLKKINPCEISEDSKWSNLISDIITTSISVNETVAPVVNNSSPEGHLPMDMGPGAPHLEDSRVRTEDGTKITAQMVLLCAWRSVKEVSLLLGDIAGSLSIEGEGCEDTYTLSQAQVIKIGEHFTTLLAETKHRGAFEQAYLGFTKLVTRLWRCRGARLQGLPRGWLAALMADIEAGGDRDAHCPTRRSAGVPLMMQALVTTELQVFGNPKCFHESMSTLLRLASWHKSEHTRTHSLNILRALFRHTALGENVSSYVADGFVVAISGFDGKTWVERNSSTLLFSALIVRVFGVQRGRDADDLCIRNRMTGRIFFLRYPKLYDFMLMKLKDSNVSGTELRPSLYPVLLLLSRLYPSSLEGTVSNLKLVAFIPYVLSCAASAVLKTRQLAAKAMLPLISPEQYISHLEDMFRLISDRKIKTNYCHGILLQILKLLETKRDHFIAIECDTIKLKEYFEQSLWILCQATTLRPCYILADEFVKIINVILWRFPSIITSTTLNTIQLTLEEILFGRYANLLPYPGKDVCLANVTYINAIILIKSNLDKMKQFILRALTYRSYEVLLSSLNMLLVLYKMDISEDGNAFLTHWSEEAKKHVLLSEFIIEKKDLKWLCRFLEINNNIECIQKILTILSLEDGTQLYIINIKEYLNGDVGWNQDVVVPKLLECIKSEHEKFRHIYLKSLTKYVKMPMHMDSSLIMDILNIFWKCSTSENNVLVRREVVNFVELNYDAFLRNTRLSVALLGKFHVTLFATMVTLLEDDDEVLRQKMANIVCDMYKRLNPKPEELWDRVIPSKAGEILRDFILKYFENSIVFFSEAAIVILLALSLCDYRSEVCVTDDLNEECRVFDQNERYNVHLEETIWSIECIKTIETVCTRHNIRPLDLILELVEVQMYKIILEKLCTSNFDTFLRMIKTYPEISKHEKYENVNPKIEVIVKMLCI